LLNAQENVVISRGFLGSMGQRCAAAEEPALDARAKEWRASTADFDLTLRTQQWQMRSWDQLCILIRGNAVATQAADVHETIHDHYRLHHALPVDRIEGSFTIVLLDGLAGEALLYRNLAGNGFTYYWQGASEFVFGSNLADLVNHAGCPATLNRNALPAYFLYRFVPGRETLFANIYRLMPGELVAYSRRGLQRLQKQTFADLKGPPLPSHDTVDSVEQVMAEVVGDAARAAPRAANLLSGGVDSSYIQALWNQSCSGKPASFSVRVDHPRTRLDTEYALTTAGALDVQHTLIPADEPYASYLVDTIASTAEPPNHVMAAYFGRLARAMVDCQRPIGLCGEGADSLFGTSWADAIYKARWLRRLVPGSGLRQAVGAVAARLLGEHVREYTRLADHVDDLDFLNHPVNRVAVFADLPALEACFGRYGLAAGTAYRRTLLPLYRVPADPLEQVHACGFLGEAVDSASLWTTLFNNQGGDLICPFLDSRVIRLALSIEPRQRFPYRRPKDLLKRALARHVPRELVYRTKLGFGQPIFEWLAAGGQLRPWVDAIDDYDFVDRQALAAARAQPNWFLYSLLCFDIWQKLFITRSLPRPEAATCPELPVGQFEMYS
jgi:asparagine synthase (glutamine-hydrolysing)